MAKKRITFTEDHLKLISALKFSKIKNGVKIKVDDEDSEITKNYGNRYTITYMPKDSEGNIIFEKVRDTNVKLSCADNDGENIYGVDLYQLYHGTYLYEDMALILGKTDHVIPETLEDPLGARYDEETMSYFYELDEFITTHIQDIFEILLQFCLEGIEPNVEYWCHDFDHIWKKKEQKN